MINVQASIIRFLRDLRDKLFLFFYCTCKIFKVFGQVKTDL